MRFESFWGLAFFFLCMLLSGAAGGWVAIWLLVPEDDVAMTSDHEVVSRAGQYELLDRDGNVRAVLRMKGPPFDTLGLVLYDADGNEVRPVEKATRSESASPPSRRTWTPVQTIICNDGTRSPTCTSCTRGCCSYHGGCR